MWNLLVMVALTTASPVEATATTLDGATLSGQLHDWQSDRLLLGMPSGAKELPLRELLSIQFRPASASAKPKPILELVDGSVLPLVDYQVSGTQSIVRLARPTPAEPLTVKIPVRQIKAVRMLPLEESAAEHWRATRALNLPSDLLVIQKRGGQSLDYLEGSIGKVSESDVEFKLEGNSIRVPREKVAGIVYYRSDRERTPSDSTVLIGDGEVRIVVSTVHLDGDELHVTTPGGVRFEWPLAEIRTADFSAGKVVFLSDLEPVSQAWHPLVGMPASATYASRYGLPRMDQSATGGPLALADPDDDLSVGERQGRTFAKGLALRARTQIEFRLPKGYSRLMTIAGIDPETRATGQVVLSILADDRTLLETPIFGSSAPMPIELDIDGVKRLRILVDYGENLDTGDWLNLCNARIVK